MKHQVFSWNWNLTERNMVLALNCARGWLMHQSSASSIDPNLLQSQSFQSHLRENPEDWRLLSNELLQQLFWGMIQAWRERWQTSQTKFKPLEDINVCHQDESNHRKQQGLKILFTSGTSSAFYSKLDLNSYIWIWMFSLTLHTLEAHITWEHRHLFPAL